MHNALTQDISQWGDVLHTAFVNPWFYCHIANKQHILLYLLNICFALIQNQIILVILAFFF